ncbi:LysR family transcriptional regulator [Skermanella rosea]|uniref:LysR substrate-binding domain-containing protein n=1 Tax=Skermanella rosea TaxID=1817965 RepID=UPI001931B7AA|nr:LysR substrate-binding domain-containing protein [Skermanella rosea]UEM05757.1 LysR family transcriptional regulator [Skermanella rosea]
MSFAGLSLRDLEYLVAVADLRHFGQAAQQCGVSQPALSGQIRKLEDLLGTPVFERAGRKVLLTARGDALVAQARRVLEEAQRLVELARDLNEPLSGRLGLSAIQTLGPYLFPHVLRPLRECFPRLDLILGEGRTGELLAGLRAGRIDAVLVALPVRERGVTVEPLFFEPFLLAHPAGHRLGSGAAVTAADLPADDLMLLEEGHCLRDQALAVCGAGGSPGGRARHATSLETLRHMVAAGAGYTLMPALAAGEDDTLGGLVAYRPFVPDPPGRTIALAWRSSDPRAAQFHRLADCLADAALNARPPRPPGLTAPQR